VSIAGVGMLAGSLVMSAWGGFRRRVYGVLGFELLSGI
jgi:DHA3 family macrolide efflux protein-like MFS transporter